MRASTRARSRVWVGSGFLLVSVVGVAIVLWLGRDANRSGEGRRAGTARGFASRRDGSRAGREDARTAMRSGRFDEAFSFYREGPQDLLEAEDLFTMGTALLERNRLVLGWTALEAARRVDPKHGPSNRALNGLQEKLGAAGAPEQTSLREAADAVDLLRSIRGGPPLGILVLGLAGSSRDPGREPDLLDRLLLRDRAVLRAVATPGDAIKLVARLLMETGRPAEAVELLRPLLAGAGRPGIDGGPPPDPRVVPDAAPSPAAGPVAAADREAAWLLSRVALQLDEDEAADALLVRAAGFGQGESPSPEPAPFVGSRQCRECHSAVYRAQQLGSAHAQTLYRGSSLKDVPLPSGPVPDPVVPGTTHHFVRRGDDRIELQTHTNTQVVRALIEYAVGSGRHGITMVAKDDQLGVDRELRISYFGADRTWGETKGITFRPFDPGDSLGLALTPKALRQCLHCHATWFRAANPLPSVPSGPEAQDHGIGCERCHGPGLNHVKAVRSGFADLAIAGTRRTGPRELLRSCDECHASNGSVEPNDPEFTRVQGTTLRFSRCFTGTQGRIHCATCHDPHRNLETAATHYEAKCLSCHAAPTPPSAPASSSARPGAAQPSHPDAPACPVNPRGECIACHMPKVSDPSRRARFTDHDIRVHRRATAG